MRLPKNVLSLANCLVCIGLVLSFWADGSLRAQNASGPAPGGSNYAATNNSPGSQVAKTVAPAGKPQKATTAQRHNMLRAAEQRPLSFIPGSSREQSLFTAAGADFALSLERSGLTIKSVLPLPAAVEAPKSSGAAAAEPVRISVPRDFEEHFAHVEFLNANPDIKISGDEPLAAKVNYFVGNDPSKWRSNVETYQRVRYQNLYPGIDLVFYSKSGRTLEYDLVVAPGADPGKIRMRVSSEDKSSIDDDGNLRLDGAKGNISLQRPMLYQDIANGKKAIAGNFVQVAENEFAFRQAAYDKSRPLIIDPTLNLLYSTYMGGIHDDVASALVLDAAKNSYIVGFSASQDFPVSANAYQPYRKEIGVYIYNATILKFNSSGDLLYSTFVGGTGGDFGYVIAVDAVGNAYIGGNTASTDFPVTSNAYQSTAAGGFLSEISPDGSTLEYSTYFPTAINGIALNSSGQVVIGASAGSGMPTTTGAYMTTLATGTAAYAAIIDPTQTGTAQLVAGTYYGTNNPASSNILTGALQYAFALDPSGNVWLGGRAYTPNLPTTANAIQPVGPTIDPNCQGYTALGSVAFFAELSPDLTQLKYATYFSGGTSTANDCGEWAGSMAFDSSGNLYVGGVTPSGTFPVTTGSFQTAYPGNQSTDGFEGWVAKFNPATFTPTTSSAVWSSYLGGNGGNAFIFGTADHGAIYGAGGNVAPDSAGNLWVSGDTEGGSNFPVPSTAYQANHQGGYDAFVLEVSADGTTILDGTYLNGSSNSAVSSLAVDAAENLYLAGATNSTDFPITASAAQPLFANGDSGADNNDMFFSILGAGSIGTIGPAVGGDTGDTTITISGTGFESGATCSLTMGSTTITATSATVNAAGTSITCTFALNGATDGSYNVAVSNPNGGSTFTQQGGFTVQSGGEPNMWVNIVGRPKIRTGSPSNIVVNFGNSGSVDAYMAHLTVTMPSNLQASFLANIPPALTSGAQTPTSITNGNTTTIRLLLPRVLAGASGSFPITVTDNTDGDQFTIDAEVTKPWFTSASQSESVLTQEQNQFTPASAPCGATASSSAGAVDCSGAFLTQFVNAGATTAQVQAMAGAMLSTLQQVEQYNTVPTIFGGSSYTASGQLASGSLVLLGVPSYDNTIEYHVQGASSSNLVSITSSNCVSYANNVNDALGGTLLQCTIPNVLAPEANNVIIAGGSFGLGQSSSLIPQFDGCFTTMQNITQSGFTFNSTENTQTCNLTGENGEDPDAPPKVPDDTIIPIGGFPDTESSSAASGYPSSESGDDGTSGSSIDPNGKVGPVGDGSSSHYIRGATPLTYNVYFENQATASLPAAQVVVTDQLDTTKVNPAMLTLGPISFGLNVITPPTGVTSYDTTFTPPGVTNYVVRIQGSFNQSTGLLKWTFATIDPTTGLPPTDSTVGFLPPDVDGVEGQGSVVFNIMPTTGQSTGTQINNAASVVFDTNAPINTPIWLNTLDVDAPVSQITALPATENAIGGAFNVSWSGTDKGSGIATYTIYVSDNGGAFTVWQNAVTATSASYTGTVGHTYGFYSIATDGAGNAEAAKTSADTTTQVVLTSSTTTLTASSTSITPGTSVTLTATVAGSSGSTTIPTGSIVFMDGSTSLSTAALNGSGVATLTTTSLPAGSDSITAVYSGDTNYAASTSSAVTVAVASSSALTPTTTSLASSSASANAGASVTFTATVSSASGTPAGTVTFLDGTTALGTGSLNSSSVATYSTSTLAAGSHSITAQYGGSATYAASTSSVLTETIVAQGFTIAINPSSLTVSPGAAGIATITVTSTGGFNQPISFNCAGLPANAVCTFSPATITPSGGGAVTATLTVATDVNTASLLGPSGSTRHPGSPEPIPLFAAVFLGLGGLAARRRRRGASGAAALWPVLLMILLGAGWLSGCGEGGSPKTPPGSSTVTVTAVASGSNQTAALTLVVQ